MTPRVVAIRSVVADNEREALLPGASAHDGPPCPLDHRRGLRRQAMSQADAKTLSFFGGSGPSPLTLSNSRLSSRLTRPGIETRYLE
jgi:hypothetical protein